MTGAISIQLNGEARQVPTQSTAEDLVALLALQGARIAMEVNNEILPRSGYAQYRLQAGDKIEIVHAVGGGA